MSHGEDALKTSGSGRTPSHTFMFFSSALFCNDSACLLRRTQARRLDVSRLCSDRSTGGHGPQGASSCGVILGWAGA